MNSLDYVVDKVLSAIRRDITKKTTGYDAVGTVRRIDGNTAWVHFDNGVDETPVNKSINCNKGDKVRVRISNGSAFIVGNDSAPPTDDTKAEQALAQVQDTEVRVEEISTSIVTDDKIMYLVTDQNTGVTRDTAGWQETPQTMTEQYPYLWTYHIYSVGQGDATYSDPVLTGVYGERGADIDEIEEYYAVNADADNPPADSAFTTNYQQPTEATPYLWNREKIIFSDSSYHFTPKHVLSTWNPGAEGRGIANITNYYQRTQTADAPSTWSTTPPTITSTYKYLWNYERITYTDGLNPTTTTPHIIGVYGDTGAQGPQGVQGVQGETGSIGPQGVSVTSIVPYYYLSSSSSSATGGSWSTTPQTFVHGKYYWTREHIYYSNNTNNYSDAVYNRALTDANETAYTARTQAEGINQYFWSKQTGGTTDIPTGSYVTEVPQSEFTDTSHANYCSGGNLVMQSNRIRLRVAAQTLAQLVADGTTTGLQLFEPSDSTNPTAQFLSNSSIIGKTTTGHVIATSNMMQFMANSSYEGGRISWDVDTITPYIRMSSRFASTNSVAGIYTEAGPNEGFTQIYALSQTRTSEDTPKMAVKDESTRRGYITGLDSLDVEATNTNVLGTKIDMMPSINFRDTLTGSVRNMITFTGETMFKTFTVTGTATISGSSGSGSISCTGTVPTWYTPIAVQSITTNHTVIGSINRFSLTSKGVTVGIRNNGSSSQSYTVTAEILCVRSGLI